MSLTWSVVGAGLVCAVVAATPAAADPPPAAPASGSCDGGSTTWHAASPGVTVVARPANFRLGGQVTGCQIQGIRSGTVAGTSNEENVNCFGPHSGPADLTITWNDGRQSHLVGDWRWDLANRATSTLDVVDGVAQGRKATVVIEPPDESPAAVSGCISGLTFGRFRIVSVKVD
ncbi:MAG: hypothetical protein HOQ24_06980 [Mycobacteriaceae bacterium]|nr:hypothetical protein [Mycobacteriaceae bacterium]